jgi:hypothetical protein
LKNLISSIFVLSICICILHIHPAASFGENSEDQNEDSFYEQWLRVRGSSSFFGMMPDTSVAISDDAYALWNNPAGIHFQSKSKKTASIYLSTSQYQRNQDSWDFTFSGCLGSFGFGYSRLNNEDSEFRLDTYIIGSKVNVNDLFSVGLSLRRFNSTFEEDGEGYGVDGGFLIRPHPHLSFGVSIRNVNEPHF